MKTFEEMTTLRGLTPNDIAHYASLSSDPVASAIYGALDECMSDMFEARESAETDRREAERMGEQRDDALTEIRTLKARLADAALTGRKIDKLLASVRSEVDSINYTVNPEN